MAACPTCGHDVRTPFFLDLEGWAHLVCPDCKARLEMKPPRFALFGPVMVPLFILGRNSRVFEIIAFVFASATMFLMLVESLRPKIRLRTKPLPKPSIRLNIDGL